MSIALSIAFTGLCALDRRRGREGRAQVLLLDAKGVGQVGGVTLPEHAPTLVVSLNDLANPDSSRPTRVIAGATDRDGRLDQLGLWDLTGSEVRIRPQGGVGRGSRSLPAIRGRDILARASSTIRAIPPPGVTFASSRT